jgi:hypothetical protein
MHQQLKFLCQTIRDIDNDPVQSLSYYTGATVNPAICLKAYDDVRWELIKETLHKAEHYVQRNNQCHEVDHLVDKNLESFNQHYQNHQDLCWPCHQGHFHVTIQEYVNCPTTCLCEIEEFVQKLMRRIYQQ